VLARIKGNPLVHGVTFSGGEPFEQAEALLPLAEELKSQGYHLMAFTGYTMEQLLQKPERAALLEKLDLLVDGPFLEAEKSLDLRFRGSRNQRILNIPASRANGWQAVLDELNEAVER
jgi:anaerobic ribonucleoside-triphosphate reductase activating protein